MNVPFCLHTYISTGNTVNIYTKSYRRAIKSAVCWLHCNPTRVFGYSALHNTALFQSWYAQSEFFNLVCCLLSVGCTVIRHGCLGIQHCTTLPSSRAGMHSQNLLTKFFKKDDRHPSRYWFSCFLNLYSALHNIALFQSWYAQSKLVSEVF